MDVSDSHFRNLQVPNSFYSDLVISPVYLKDAGFYICRVNCGGTFEFSQWVQVDVLNVSVSCGEILQGLLAPCTMLRNAFVLFTHSEVC